MNGRSYALRDLCSRIDYGLTASTSSERFGPKFLRITDIVNGPGDYSSVPHVDAGPAAISKNLLERGDIVIARTGATVGASHWFEGAVTPVVFASYLVRFRVREGVSSRYASYALKSTEWHSYIRNNAHSKSAQPNLGASAMADFQIALPGLDVQEGIAEVLGVLDDKIAANHRVVSSLEQLRKTLWIRASQGAGESPLSSHAQFVNGGAYTKGATGVGRVVIRIAELNSGIGSSTVYNDLDVPDRQIAHAGDLLMSWSGSLTAVRWYREDAIVNQHIFKVIPRDDLPVWAVACAVETKLAEFREIAAGKATTMGHIKRADLDSPVAWPEISDRLNDAGTALWDRALAAEKENLRLADTRDELLPLLMSGKITVKDAEKTVEEVV